MHTVASLYIGAMSVTGGRLAAAAASSTLNEASQRRIRTSAGSATSDVSV